MISSNQLYALEALQRLGRVYPSVSAKFWRAKACEIASRRVGFQPEALERRGLVARMQGDYAITDAGRAAVKTARGAST